MKYKDLSKEELIEVTYNYLACIQKTNELLTNVYKEEYGWTDERFVRVQDWELAWDWVEIVKENLQDAITRVSEKLKERGFSSLEEADIVTLILLCTYLTVMMREGYQGFETSFHEANPCGPTDKVSDNWMRVKDAYIGLRNCLNDNGYHCL